MRLAFWPGLAQTANDLRRLEPALGEGVPLVPIDPGYSERTDWTLGSLAQQVTATRAAAYGGASWGGAVAAVAAAADHPRALVLVDGGHLGPRDLARFGDERTVEERVASLRSEHAELERSGSPLPLSADALEAIVRAYDEYDAPATLRSLAPRTRVLLVAARLSSEHAATSARLVGRFAELVPQADVHEIDGPHDVVRSHPERLGAIIGEWIRSLERE